MIRSDSVRLRNGDVVEKHCPTCDTWKRAIEFTKNKRYIGGLHYECRACKANRAAEDYQRNAETRKATAARYREENREKLKEIAEAYKPTRRERERKKRLVIRQ